VGWLSLGTIALGLVARHLPFASRPVVIGAALFPYLALAGPLSVIVFSLRRRWLLVGASATVTAAAIATQIPQHLSHKSENARRGVVPVRVMSVNLCLGRASAASLVGSALENADVVAVQELTPEGLARLSAAGMDAAFPYRHVYPRPGAHGIGLWSKFALSQAWTIAAPRMPFAAAKIAVPGAHADPLLVVVHVTNPWHIDGWAADIRRLSNALREAEDWSEGAAVIVAGDFNSTLDMRPFRDVLRLGYRDAARQAGAGFTLTFPGSMPVPPLAAIDHILVRRCTAVTARTLIVPGSDHRALVATITINQPIATSA